MSDFPYQQLQALVLEHLKSHYRGQYTEVVTGVVSLARAKGVHSGTLCGTDRDNVPEGVRQIMWRLLVQQVIVFGMNEANPNWPWYRLTGHGEQVVQDRGPQPYDPDGFLADFRNQVPAADDVIIDYLAEAVRAFNHGCPKSSIVMLGCASEKAILLLHEQFRASISDPSKRQRFEGSYRSTISSKFDALRNRLVFMIDQGRLPRPLRELVQNELSGSFQLFRRQRNAAGHPEIVGDVNLDGVFLNLRIFTEYSKAVYALIAHFRTNAADPY